MTSIGPCPLGNLVVSPDMPWVTPPSCLPTNIRDWRGTYLNTHVNTHIAFPSLLFSSGQKVAFQGHCVTEISPE